MADTEKLLAELADKIKREAYAAGWRDAMLAVTKAVTDAKSPDVESITLEERTDTPPGRRVNGQDGPKMGTTPWYVLDAVVTRPGMSGAEIVTAVRAGGHNVGEPQIRTALVRLGAKNLIVNRHRKWFPT